MEISVIIPTYNRASVLAKTLEYLRGLEGTGMLDWEIIVVDNNSRDETKNVTESFASRSGLNVRYFLQEEQGSSHARNRGIHEAAGEIIIFIDDDVVIPPRWLLEMKKAFEDYQAACVGGRILLDKAIKLPPWWPERLRAPLSLLDLGDQVIVSNRDHAARAVLAYGGNAGVRRSALERNGGFRTDMRRGGDGELVMRLQRNGEAVVYYPRALLYHSPDINRFTKDSLPGYFYHFGAMRCHVELISSEKTRRIAGVPLWRYRLLLENSLKAFRGMLTLNRKEAFYQRMGLYEICGYVVGIIKMRRSALLSYKPEPVKRRIA